MTVDFRLRLVWTTAFDADSGNLGAVNADPDGLIDNDGIIPWHLYPTLVRHKLTGEVPVALHFNMYTRKGMMDEWWGSPWWTSGAVRFKDIISTRMLNASLSIADRSGGLTTEKFSDICHDHV